MWGKRQKGDLLWNWHLRLKDAKWSCSEIQPSQCCHLTFQSLHLTCQKRSQSAHDCESLQLTAKVFPFTCWVFTLLLSNGHILVTVSEPVTSILQESKVFIKPQKVCLAKVESWKVSSKSNTTSLGFSQATPDCMLKIDSKITSRGQLEGCARNPGKINGGLDWCGEKWLGYDHEERTSQRNRLMDWHMTKVKERQELGWGGSLPNRVLSLPSVDSWIQILALHRSSTDSTRS